jgi:hypothetical protein
MQSQDALARDWTEFLKADAGRPLNPRIRTHFEGLFLTGLSHVRVHTGPLASEFARRLGARAFTFATTTSLSEKANISHSRIPDSVCSPMNWRMPSSNSGSGGHLAALEIRIRRGKLRRNWQPSK